MARYTLDDADQLLPTDFPQFPRSFVSRNQFLTLEYRDIASASTLHTLRGGFSGTRIGQDVEANLEAPPTSTSAASRASGRRSRPTCGSSRTSTASITA